MSTFKVIGVMSGTSMDGVDIAYCHIHREDRWTFSHVQGITVPYPEEWEQRLTGCAAASAFGFVKTHTDYGHYLGKLVKEFVEARGLEPDFVSSHGHTVFHQPHLGVTCQIGDGAAIAAECRLPVICDFRSLDVALKGQGAPLVPIGDRLLFSGYSSCLNLGGIANVSFDKGNERIAFDICPANQVLNYLASRVGQPYDHNGALAAEGRVDEILLLKLDALDYYAQPYPKSLGKEWVDACFIPLLEQSSSGVQDQLATVCEHIARQTARSLPQQENAAMLVTGGGALNGYLVNRLKALCKADIHLPDESTIHFKEAIVFAFLGVLRKTGEHNALRSVTGAVKDSCGGCIYEG